MDDKYYMYKQTLVKVHVDLDCLFHLVREYRYSFK